MNEYALSRHQTEINDLAAHCGVAVFHGRLATTIPAAVSAGKEALLDVAKYVDTSDFAQELEPEFEKLD